MAVRANEGQSDELAPPTLTVWNLGRMEYGEAWALQNRLAEQRRQGEIGDMLLFVEHPHTYTLGRRGDPANILIDADELARREIAIHNVDRGGDVTYHGPGQLVGYPILDLRALQERLYGEITLAGSPRRYAHDIEEIIIQTLAELGITAMRLEGSPGVWVDGVPPCKITAIGMRVSRGITTHGFALNVETDLRYFSYIIPCGIADKGVTSITALTGSSPGLTAVAALTAQTFARYFRYESLKSKV